MNHDQQGGFAKKLLFAQVRLIVVLIDMSILDHCCSIMALFFHSTDSVSFAPSSLLRLSVLSCITYNSYVATSYIHVAGDIIPFPLLSWLCQVQFVQVSLCADIAPQRRCIRKSLSFVYPLSNFHYISPS